jgi:hypothetical protein
MVPYEGGKMGDYMVGPIDGELGPMFMLTAPPLVKQDFYQAYAQPTFWPYCESLERCVVYRCGHFLFMHEVCYPGICLMTTL